MTTPLALLVAVIAQLLLGSSGAGAQLLPASVADGDVFASVGKSTVEWRHADTSSKGSMTASGSTPWTNGLAYRADTGSQYVAGNNAINVFDANGAWAGTFGSGYNSDPIRVFLVPDASLLEEGTTDLTIWVEKPVLGQRFFSVVPDCSDLVGADAVTGCVADQTVDPVTGDIETEDLDDLGRPDVSGIGRLALS